MKSLLKKNLSFLLILVFILSIIQFKALTVRADTSNDFTIEDGTLNHYNGPGGVVVIPDSVKYINGFSFDCNEKITKVIIPNGVSDIGDCAFNGCTKLSSINLPNSLKYIGEDAFSDCTSLTSITIPNNSMIISAAAFADCTSLTSVTFPNNSFIEIACSAFENCTHLKNITIPNNIILFGSQFSGCTSLNSITMPNNEYSFIDEDMFKNCTNLHSIIIPKGITCIGDGAFDDCTKLTIYCEHNSCAEAYALNNKIPFKLIGGSQVTKFPIVEQEITTNIGSIMYLDQYPNLNMSFIEWKSDDPNVATVADRGAVTAVGAGTTIITAYSDGTQYGIFTINVEAKKDNLVIRNGNNTDLKSYLNLSSDLLNGIIWASSDNNIAKVSNGVVTGLNNGTVTITASGSDGTQYGAFTIDIVTNDINSGILGTIRLGGTDRYETSAKISQAGWKQSSKYAVIATGNNYPDALSAAPLAKKYNAPILLTDTNTIPKEILSELTRMEVDHVFIVGGTGVVSQAVEDKLKSMGITVERFGGKDRFETSVKIARKLGIVSGQIFITNGYEFADALSASSIAAKMNMPILITDKNTIPDVVKNFINENNFNKTYVLGDTDLVSDNVKAVLPSPERIVGKTIYERNINIIKRFQNNIDFSNICVATGKNFSDALSGSALATMVSSAIVLVDNNDLQEITTKYSNQKIMQVNNVYVFGQQGAVSDDIIKKLFNK